MNPFNLLLSGLALISLFTDDVFAVRADAFFRGRNLQLILSDFAAAEFSSVVARSARMKQMTQRKARILFSDFDDFRIRRVSSVETISADGRGAEAMLRRLDLPLRAPDAIHIAIAQRLGAELATFDEKMAQSARRLGLPVAAV